MLLLILLIDNDDIGIAINIMIKSVDGDNTERLMLVD